MRKGRYRKDRKARKRSAERRRRHRLDGAPRNAQSVEALLPLAYIDPLNMVLLRDDEEHAKLFWEDPLITCADAVAQIGNRHNTGQRFLSGENAQAALNKPIDELVSLLQGFLNDKDSFRLFILLRGSYRKETIGSFLDGQCTANLPLDRDDLLDVVRMLELALSLRASEADYFKKYGSADFSIGDICTGIENLPKLAPEDILSLRQVLDIGRVLYLYKKAYYLAGHGAHVAIDRRGIILIAMQRKPVLEALKYYRLRTLAQDRSMQQLAVAGYPGRLVEGERHSASILVMRKISGNYSSYMNNLRLRYPSEYNPHNFEPVWLDMSVCFGFLRRMGAGVMQKVSQLTPDQIIACVTALSELGWESFCDNGGRCWLGCYGCLPVTRSHFNIKMTEILNTKLAMTNPAECSSILARFEREFQLQRVLTTGLSQARPVLEFASLSNAVFPMDSADNLLIDFLDLPRDIARWLGRLKLDGIEQHNRRGILFEAWLRDELEMLCSSDVSKGSHVPRQGEKVRIHKRRELTDIDVIWPRPPYLLVISCKSFDVSPEEVMGEQKAVENKWNKVSEYLAEWDKKIREFFSIPEWRRSYSTIATLANGCHYVLPVLISTRVEWIPELNKELMLLRAAEGRGIDGLAVPRIGTFDDLRRMVLRGGPDPPHDAEYVIKIT